jgi:hypothetical protein
VKVLENLALAAAATQATVTLRRESSSPPSNLPWESRAQPMASASSPASGGGGGGGTPAPQPAVPTLDVDIESAAFDPLLGTVVYAVGVRSSCRSGAAGEDGGVAEQEEQGAASGGAMRVLQKRFSDFNALYTHVSGGPSLMPYSTPSTCTWFCVSDRHAPPIPAPATSFC